MSQTITLLLGPPHIAIDKGIVGSEVRFSLYVRRKTAPSTFVPFDFTGYTLESHVKAHASDPDPPLAVATVTAPGVGGAGYMDVVIAASDTTTIGPTEVVGSIKMWPTGDEDAAKTLATFTLPLEYAATW